MTKPKIGLRQAKLLCSMPHNERLDFIAEGLPIILESALGFWIAAEHIEQKPREADVLIGFAEEEAAKILILMDIVRCPPQLVASKIRLLVGWFYNHLARLLYAEAQTLRPMHVSQLRDYIDDKRKAHYLDGYAGEYIVPNWYVFQRESKLYADIAAYEGGTPMWSKPTGDAFGFSRFKPTALKVAESLSMLGVFSPRGVRAASDVWGVLEFKDSENWQDSTMLSQCLVEKLIAENLYSDKASEDDVSTLCDSWQLPMYNLDFSLSDVPLAELEKARDAMSWAEAGSSRNGEY